MTDIQVNFNLDELIAWASSVDAPKTARATRLAINDTLRWSRTRIGRSIRETYNIKAPAINSSDIRTGLKAHLTNATNTEGKITGGHRPVTLASINGVRATKQGVTLSIIKGQRKLIRSAFILPKFGGLVFARGIYAKSGFEFRHKRVTPSGSPDTPIDVIRTTSIATAALNTRSFSKWQQPVTERYDQQVRRQISRLIGV